MRLVPQKRFVLEEQAGLPGLPPPPSRGLGGLAVRSPPPSAFLARGSSVSPLSLRLDLRSLALAYLVGPERLAGGEIRGFGLEPITQP